MLVLLEGLDLAGKTSISRALVRRLGPSTTSRNNSIIAGNEVYAYANMKRATRRLPSRSVGYLYLAALHVDLARYVPDTGTVIQDSTMAMRCYAYYRARQDRVLAQAFKRTLYTSDHPRFDHAFILTADLEERRRRLEKRLKSAAAKITEDDYVVQGDPALFLRNERILIRTTVEKYNARLLDTTGKTVGELADWIAARIAR